MFNETIILLQNLTTVSAGSVFSFTNKTPGPGYYRQDDSTRTASYDFTNFVGTVKIQASLDLTPGDNDWFDVTGTTFIAGSSVNTTESYSFNGNFIWIRVAYNLQSGRINRVAVSGITVTASSQPISSVAFADIINKPTTVLGYGITDAVSASDLGAFEFTGSVITTTDSTAIIIDQATTVTSDLTVGGDIVPSTANGGNLGSPTKPFRSLFVSNNTIFLGNIPLSLEPGTNELRVNNVPISQTINYADIANVPTAFSGSYADLSNKPTIPVDIDDLTDTGNLLFDGDYTSLSNRPTIPVDIDDLTDTGNLLFDGDYTSLSNRPTIPVDIDDLTDTGNALASELVSPTVPTIGGTASAGEAGITYLSGDLSKWAIFTVGAFTIGEWTDVQPGWTVTDNNGFTDIIAGRGSFGAASFQTTVNSWPSPASGKTYVFTSPDYQLGYTNPVEITVGDNDWTFDLNGVLTLPIGATNNGRISNINGISLAVDTSFWTFDPSGALTIPGDIRSESAINIDINLSDSTLRRWRFGEDGDLTFPDATVQTTAFTGNAATIDITDTNGIDTNYYLTFVENRDGGEILRADVDLIFNSADNTLTAGNITTGVLKIDDGVHEKFQTKADATGVVTHDCALGHIIYHTSPDDYFTVNLTNLNLASGYATSITVVMVQGATGYGPNALQIGGVAQTINWQGGSLPAAPTANGVDVMTFSILNNSGTYTVLGQVTGFNEVA